MDETIKMYRACYFINGEKHYVKNGKYYHNIGACKKGIRNDSYYLRAGAEKQYTIEEYEVKWVCDPQYAIIKRNSDEWDWTVEYKKVD